MQNGYVVFIRYGRIGEVGRIDHDQHGSEGSAVHFFLKQFKAKTGNTWGEKFIKKPNKYFLSEINYDDIPDVETEESDDKPVPKSKLDGRVIKLMNLISNATY